MSDKDEVIDGIRATTNLKRNTENILTGVWTPGKVFYVDTAANGGSDNNSGLSITDPLLKINTAMDKVTANKGDVIQILGNSPSSPNDNATITCDVAGVTIRGLHGRGMLSDSGFGSPTINVPAITIAANYVTIENLYIGCKSTGTTGGIVEFSGTNSYFGVTFRNITFDTQYVAAYGIYVQYDQPYLLVEDCMFGRSDIAGYTTACIYVGNCTCGMIRRNVFAGFAGIGISCGGSCGNLTILDNRFRLPSHTEGKAITMAAGSSGNYIDGNHAAFGDTQVTNNPFLDSSSAGYNDWGVNYESATVTMPA